MRDFFECADTLYCHSLLDEYTDDYLLIDQFRRQLQKYQVKAAIDIANLERVFNAIEISAFLEQQVIPGTPNERIRAAFVRLVMAVLERTQTAFYSKEPDVYCSVQNLAQPSVIAVRTVWHGQAAT